MPSAPTSSGELIDLLRKSGVAPAEKLAGVSDLALPGDPQKAAAALVAQGLVTRFQAQQLLAGRHRGFRIGAYIIQDLLGRGGMGAVYLAEHLELRRKVAIKVLVPGKDEDQKLALERFQREARAAAALDHPNIVRIFDVSRQNDTPYLVMEYVDGETLQQIIDRDGAIPYTTATEYIAQAAAGLQHAHEKGFIHRDIKPGNLIRDKSGTIKILDMGLARSSSSQDKLTEQLDNGAVVGTADFIAPEQGLNQPGVDGRADIYSLGASFFSLIIGKPPFQGNTTQKLLQHQLRSAPTLASLDATLPKGLSSVVAKMLAKKPADRFQNPAEVIAALAPWMANSARILAGLSRTNLAQGADLQAKLSEIALGNSRRLNTASALDSGEVDPSAATQDTGAVAGAATTREQSTRRSRSEELFGMPRKKAMLIAGIGVGVLLAGALVGWAAFGRGNKQEPPAADNRPRSEQEKEPKPPKGEPKKNPPKVDVPSGNEKVLFRLDLAAQKPFAVRSGLTSDPNTPNKKDYHLVSQSGAQPPAGWFARVWNKDSEMEYFSQDAGGSPVLGIRGMSGPGSAMLFTPKFDCPSGACRLRFEYNANVRDGRFAVRFKPADNRPAWDVVKPPVTGGAWRSEELECDLKGATGGYFEFHNSDDRPTASVRFRSLAVTEPKAAAAAATRVVYKLDLSKQKPFRVRGGGEGTGNQGRDVRFVQAEKTGDGDWPAGWSGMPWDRDAEAEYWVEVRDGRTVLGMKNLSKISAMMLSPDMTVASRRCRVRFEYMADGDLPRAALLKFKAADQPNSEGLQELMPLEGTGGKWREAETEATLKYATGFFEFHALDGDSDRKFQVRSFEVLELGNTAEKVLFQLDAADIAPFKNTRQGSQKTAGDDPPSIRGVYFHGWKPETVSEWECKTVAGAKAIGYANVNEVNSAQIGLELEQATGIALKFEPGQRVRVRVVYRTEGRGRGRVYAQTYGDWKVPSNVDLPNSNDAWNTVDLVATRGDKPLRCLIDTSETGAGNTLYVRSVTVSDAGQGGVPVAMSDPAPAADDPANWAEGASLYTLDVAKIPEFRVVKEQSKLTKGAAEQLPAGIGCHCWKENAIGEFRCEKLNGVPALGLTNLNDEQSGQFFFSLETGMKLSLQPGKGYRVKVGYMAKNDATGHATVHVVPGFRGIGSRALPNTSDKWATGAVSFVRPAADEKVEVRLVIDNTSVGEGNTLWVRSLEVVELVPPKK